MIIAGIVENCFLFSCRVVSGNFFMKCRLPVSKNLKKSGECCLFVEAWASRDSCAYCPGVGTSTSSFLMWASNVELV